MQLFFASVIAALAIQLFYSQIAKELRASIQRSYVETLQRLDGALTANCAEFDPARYSKV